LSSPGEAERTISHYRYFLPVSTLRFREKHIAHFGQLV
jgi:hypothetical protein